MDTLSLARLNETHPTPFLASLLSKKLDEETNLEILFYLNYAPGLIRWARGQINYLSDVSSIDIEDMDDLKEALIVWARSDLASLVGFMDGLSEENRENYDFWGSLLYVPLLKQRQYGLLVTLINQEIIPTSSC